MLRYFLGIEVMQRKHEIFLSQRKYVLDLFSETGKLGVKPCNYPMASSIHLRYLKGVSGRGILYSNHGHNRIECFTYTDWVGSKEDRRSTSPSIMEK